MIRVTKIVGESFDIDTKQETPKMIVLSNGRRDISTPVSDEVAQAIVTMLLEDMGDLRVAPVQEFKVPAPQKGNGKPRPKTPKKPEFIPEDGPGDEYDDPATGVGSL